MKTDRVARRRTLGPPQTIWRWLEPAAPTGCWGPHSPAQALALDDAADKAGPQGDGDDEGKMLSALRFGWTAICSVPSEEGEDAGGGAEGRQVAAVIAAS